MFLKTAGFKKLIKEAYKGAGLRVGATGQTYYLSGGYWVIEIKKHHLPKEKLAAIIELIGELPEPGIGFCATKDGQQYELQWNDLYNAIGNAERCGEEMEVTGVMIESRYGSVSRVLQHKGTGTIRLVNEKFIGMIDSGEVDGKNGHTPAEGPLVGRLPGVFWKNNVMALYVMPRADATMLIRYLEGIDINKLAKEDENNDVPEDTNEEEAEET